MRRFWRAREGRLPVYRRYGQRLFDCTLTVLALVVFAPVLLLVVLIVRQSLGAPIFFRQTRLGKDGAEFAVLKFRTMTDTRDANGNLLPDEQRMTRVGNLLRRTSLDELPELVNVLRGEMSLVGPRPLFAHYRERYTPEQ